MITFITGFPENDKKSDGYWSRVRAIDSLFENHHRTYIDIQFGNNFETDLLEYKEIKEGKKFIFKINWNSGLGRTKFEEILLKSNLIYIHSIYQARYVLPFLPFKKVILDLHGVVPEENLIYQDISIFEEMNDIERYAFENSAAIVTVTQKMIGHFLDKYKSHDKLFFTLPIVRSESVSSKIIDSNIIISEMDKNFVIKEKVFIYSGGNQPWQNLSLIYDFIQKSSDDCKFVFLSPDKDQIYSEIQKINCLEKCEFFYSSDFSELRPFYLRAHFGFILRDNNAVNQVACPTKMQDYFQYGVVPVVLNEELGDFKELGYKSLLISDLNKNENISQEDLKKYVKQNLNVLNMMKNNFVSESEKLYDFVLKLSELEHKKQVQLPALNGVSRNFAQIYLNHGAGYSESVSIKRSILNNNVNLVFKILPSWQGNIKTIRFDPLNKPCRIKFNKIVFFGQDRIYECKLSQFSKEKYLQFDEEDPKIDLYFGELNTITMIEINYEIFDQREFNKTMIARAGDWILNRKLGSKLLKILN